MNGYSKKISPIDLPKSRDDLSISGDSFTDGEDEPGASNMSKLSNFINWRKGSPQKTQQRQKQQDDSTYRDNLEEEARVERDRSKFEARIILNIESAVYDTHQLIHTQNDKFMDRTDSLALLNEKIGTRIDSLVAQNKETNTRIDGLKTEGYQKENNQTQSVSLNVIEDLSTRLKEVEHKNKFLAKHLLESDGKVASQSDHIRVLEEHNKELSVRNEGYENRLAQQDGEQQELRSIVSKLQSDLRGLSVLALERIQGLEKSVEKNEGAHHRKTSSLPSVRDENTPSSVNKSPAKQAPARRSPASPVKQSPAIKAKAKQFT